MGNAESRPPGAQTSTVQPQQQAAEDDGGELELKLTLYALVLLLATTAPYGLYKAFRGLHGRFGWKGSAPLGVVMLLLTFMVGRVGPAKLTMTSGLALTFTGVSMDNDLALVLQTLCNCRK
eukprot:tig00000403_g281.t1